MTEYHDPMCDEYVGDWRGNRPCYCDLIMKVRAEQRTRLVRDEGWMSDGAHEATVAVAKVRAVREALDQLRQKIESLQEEAWIDYRSAVPGDVETVAEARLHMEAYKEVLDLIGEPNEIHPHVYQTPLGWVAADAGGWTNALYQTENEARADIGLPPRVESDG